MRAKTDAAVFYVYEHWRLDTNSCFWVGKGYDGRAYDFSRNRYYNNIVKKIRNLGFEVEVKIIFDRLSEKEALRLEIERILLYRSLGVSLANMTNGGEGVSGLRHSEETIAKLRVITANRPHKSHSEETKKKIGKANSISLRGRKNLEHSVRLRGRTLTEEHKAAISLGSRGRIFSEDTKLKIRNSNLGKKRSVETRQKLSVSHRGKLLSQDTLMKMRDYRWVTDGITQLRVLKDSDLPIGFKYGRLKNRPESNAKMAESQRKRMAEMSAEKKSLIGKLGAQARWGAVKN